MRLSFIHTPGCIALTDCTSTFAAECIAARGYYRLYILSEADRQPSLKATEVVDDLTEHVAQVRGCRVYLALRRWHGSAGSYNKSLVTEVDVVTGAGGTGEGVTCGLQPTARV